MPFFAIMCSTLFNNYAFIYKDFPYFCRDFFVDLMYVGKCQTKPPPYHYFVYFFTRETIKKNCADLLCKSYKQIYDAILDPANEFREHASIVPRSPDQVIKLLT